jgi:tetratricopeptide (TPR) repeat protein
MPVLEAKYFKKIQIFNKSADSHIEAGDFALAIKDYQKAWNTLPEPKQLWDAALWIKTGQAECLMTMDDFSKGRDKLLEAMLCHGAVNNPHVHFLLGVCHYKLGDLDDARNEINFAYEIEGETLFQEGDDELRDLLVKPEQ